MMIIMFVICVVPWVVAKDVYKNTLEHAEYLRDGAKGKLTSEIVDEDGVPVAGAKIGAHFQMQGRSGIHGTSNTNGLFTMEDKSRWKMHYGVEKEGYYKTVGEYEFGRHDGIVVQDGKWQPWDPEVRVLLRPIVNPIPMYVRIVDSKVLRTNEIVGFDLMVGDWVQPVGKGIVPDFMFSIKGFWRNYRDNDSILELRCSKQEDGAVRIGDAEIAASSVLKLPRYASEVGYQNMLSWRRARSMREDGATDEMVDDLSAGGNYFFRIRSETNDLGVVTNAYYGKIRGNVEFVGAADGGNGSWLKFTYYLNPTPNDRNMEFDPKRNLFKNLSSLEEVTEP